MKYVETQNQITDIFTKPLAGDQFVKLRRDLEILDLNAIDVCENSFLPLQVCTYFWAVLIFGPSLM